MMSKRLVRFLRNEGDLWPWVMMRWAWVEKMKMNRRFDGLVWFKGHLDING